MKKVMLSGMQPSGMMHIGNYEGALKNWVALQESGEYDIYACIVDWHALTSGYDKTDTLRERIYQMAADFVAGGLDPDKTAIFIQSHIKEHSELHLLLSMIVPIPWLRRVPSYKEKVESLGLDSYGFLGYPLLQTADIIVYRANVVPVGEDQLAHLELAREIVRRFNGLYGEIFPEPKALLTKTPLVLGIDGRKMSKSYGNHICPGDSPEQIAVKVKSSYTDPKKIHRDDPGHPGGCPVFMLHRLYNEGRAPEIESRCKSGDATWGCVACKREAIDAVVGYYASFRERRDELLTNRSILDEILWDGAERARLRAAETMELVREAMGMFPEKR